MNKNAIKKFATEARRELISRVSQRALKYGISDKEVGNPNDDSVGGHLLPFIYQPSESIDDLVTKTIGVSKVDWDSFETSWDFKRSPLV